MNLKSFLLILVLWACPAFAGKPHSASEVRAMWLSFPFWDMSWEKKEIFAPYLASKGINKVYLSVYDNGISRFKSPTLETWGLATPGNDADLQRSVQLFRKNGIQVAAFFEGGMSVWLSNTFEKNHPDMLLNCGEGGTHSGEHEGTLMGWLDPSQKPVQSILVGALQELARHPAQFDEIQLDRFRFTHWNNKLCLAADGTSNPSHVNNLVNTAYHAIKAVRSTIRVTASPVGSYGFWKLNQHWGQWMLGEYIDGISTQAYIPMDDLSKCARGTPSSVLLERNVALFRAELATMSGRVSEFDAAVADYRFWGGDEGELELADRVPTLHARAAEFAANKRPIPIEIGVMAHQYDDSECVLAQMNAARDMGFNDAVLWVSAVAPNDDGSPNKDIDDNLSLLRDTIWRMIRVLRK